MYVFLSDEWMEAARELRSKYEHDLPQPSAVVRINQIITDVPFGDGTIEAYVDTSDGNVDLELGSLDEPDAVLMIDYVTAKAMIVDQDPTVVMQALLAGRVKIQGDMMKLMAMQASIAAPDETAILLAEELRAITLDLPHELHDDGDDGDDGDDEPLEPEPDDG